MEDDLFELFLEEEVKKEVGKNEFKDALSQTLKRRCSEYYTAQKNKWENFKSFSYGFNPIEKFKDIPAVCTLSLYPEYVLVGPVEKEGIKHSYTDVINNLLMYINKNIIHPYLLDLLDRGDYPFYDNHIVIEVNDNRDVESVSNRVLLRGSIGGMPYAQGVLQSTKSEDQTEAEIYAKTAVICIDPSPEVFEVMKLQDYNVRKWDGMAIDKKQKMKLQISSVIKEFRRLESTRKTEIYMGLERSSNPRIYRTTKFLGGNTHYSINALANTDYIEVIFRKGDIVNTATGGFIQRRKFTSPGQIDMYIDSLKKLLEIYHSDLKCICDVSANPRKTKQYASPYQRQVEEGRQFISPSQPNTQGSMERHMRFIKTKTIEDHHSININERQSAWDASNMQKEMDDFNFDYINKKFT
ncbi:hypothetical protein NEAUS04_0837 [Nematocida ausubeli]|uniref:Spt20-like SEP domain-containing protein n=3 Tax=Nematocida ausubeli (strain ATCC PRA-371 / ERTm2) TaxID=1913371 RepID=A0A086J363_NEMA1|nr:uncharacterized protein NESG_00732 [Nematocida ausubeli]KAI5133504.1 hypothetical protein NEAUS06_0592 [Nematocida ausubeli]KAI5133697.1 hypothetical protein NEAUS07_0528 [Nematocida ausubeli]KAI5147280.1 hypothetical protein NEAUS05_0594 [Nematocida ausubeli]KAI5162017.1 hypothetical protein NEAUS04_0837 [Nematocida ausubeli]KFG26581.1 hypothetical protein NESG_00732 [Nematocida ausubeli]